MKKYKQVDESITPIAESLNSISELLDAEFKTDVPDNIKKIYAIIEEELDFIDRHKIGGNE